MPTVRSAALLVLVSLYARSGSGALPVKATLALPDDHVLPGVPFDIIVTYTNVSSQRVTIGSATATMVVTLSGGDTVAIHAQNRNDNWRIGDTARPITLAPGESAQAPIGWASIPNWFHYGSSFSGPGTYGVALDLQVLNADAEPLCTVRTPAVTLTRVEPVGLDAALWKRMNEASDGEWTDSSFFTTKPGSALADEIVQLHPESHYYPYILAVRALNWPDKQQSRIEALLDAAERFRDSPALPYLYKAAGDSALYKGTVSARAQHTVEARKSFDLADTYYRKALATKSVTIQELVEDRLRDLRWRIEDLNRPRR